MADRSERTETTSENVRRQAPALRERVLAIPRIYYPDQDPIAWLSHFETIAKGNNWFGEARLNAVGVYMGGTAEVWYEVGHEQWTSYEAFKTEFIKRFHTHALISKAATE